MLLSDIAVGSPCCRDEQGEVIDLAPRTFEAGNRQREVMMATYIAVINFTDQGIRGIKESPNRLAAATKLAESMGVTVKQAFWTFGQFDMVTIAEGSDEAIATWMYKVGSMGNIRSTTLRAFTAEEMQQIVATIP
jgi:uncharacterized protein with GYD domain